MRIVKLPLIETHKSSEKEKTKQHYDAEKKAYTSEKPKDWAFMEQSDKVLKNLPATWMQYPNTLQGMKQIISMEYEEFCHAEGSESMSHELVHLASACLHLWRKLNHAE